jgi:hypothetical protein
LLLQLSVACMCGRMERMMPSSARVPQSRPMLCSNKQKHLTNPRLPERHNHFVLEYTPRAGLRVSSSREIEGVPVRGLV